MNVDYVSKQFYKQTGEKFSAWLNRQRIEKAKELLLNCDTEKIYTVAEAVGCGNNPQYFSQLFKKETGYTFSDYVNMRRMQIAGERLLEGAGTEEVSEAVGFESVKSFFRAFKSYYKMSPSAWKKEHSGRN